jgi:hypothetical protein
MDGLVCDACGATLLIDADVRYVLRIEGFAAYDPLELTRQDLERDFQAEMRALMESLSRLSAEEAQDQVYRSFRFDLCPTCWRRYLADPLRGLKEARPDAGGKDGLPDGQP